MAFLDLALPITRNRASLFAFAHKAAAVSRQRAALRRLDDTALADLGLTRAQAEAEANSPFWDVPATWRD